MKTEMLKNLENALEIIASKSDEELLGNSGSSSEPYFFSDLDHIERDLGFSLSCVSFSTTWTSVKSKPLPISIGGKDASHFNQKIDYLCAA